MGARTPADVEAKIVEAYSRGGSSVDIGAEFGVSNVAVGRIVRRHGGQMRNRYDSQITHKCNRHFFDVIDTEAKAYWLGFVAADGSISKGVLKIALAWVDAGHLEKFRAALASAHPIKRRVAGGGYKPGAVSAEFSVRSAELAMALAQFGIIPRKSHTVRPPTLRDDLVHHFWRGVFDGDGSICKTNKEQWRIMLVGSRWMAEGFGAFAAAASGTTAVACPHETVWGFSVGGNWGAVKVLRALRRRDGLPGSEARALHGSAPLRERSPQASPRRLTSPHIHPPTATTVTLPSSPTTKYT